MRPSAGTEATAGVVALLTAALLTARPGAADTIASATAAGTSSPAVQRTSTGFVGEIVRMRLRRAVAKLPVAAEKRRGYDRDKFRHWIDANGDCQDTRDEVLDTESMTEVSGCDITAGKWRSYYDGEVWSDSSDVDIDHLVALAEAWDSGARRWTAGTRTRYANDLSDPRPLVAVTDDVNQSKSDQDPAEWMPGLGKCRYLREWVAVKIRWRLTVNRPEKQELRERADNCKNTLVKVRRAKVVLKERNGDAVRRTVRPGTPRACRPHPQTWTARTSTARSRSPGQTRTTSKATETAGAARPSPQLGCPCSTTWDTVPPTPTASPTPKALGPRTLRCAHSCREPVILRDVSLRRVPDSLAPE